MPIFVSDSDVLAEISKVDGMVASIASTMTSLGSKVPPATLANWRSRQAAWTAWRTPIVAELSSFWTGWFGVPELGNLAVSWEMEMSGWQAIANSIAAGAASIPLGPVVTSPIEVANQNAALPPLPPGGSGLATGLVVGIGATAVLLFLARR